MPLTQGQINDWEVLAGIKPDPTAVDQLPDFGPDPWADFRVPEDANLTLEQGLGLIKLVGTLRKQRRESEAAAIRYQGEMEYQKLIESGVPPDEAMRRSAPKMFFNHPGGATAAIKAMQPPPQIAQPWEMQTVDLPNGQSVDVQINPKTGQMVPFPRQSYDRPINAKSTPEWAILNQKIRFTVSRLQKVQRDIDDRGGFAPVSMVREAKAVQDELIRLQKQQEDFARSYGTGGASTTQTASATTDVLGPSSPFAEGQVITNKKTGQKARIQNGVPVPIDQNTANFYIPDSTKTVFHADPTQDIIPVDRFSDSDTTDEEEE